MRRLLPLCLLLAAACSAPAPRVPYMDAEAKAAYSSESMHFAVLAEDEERDGLVHTLIFYIPNRIFDVFDIVRAHARLGPGFGIGGQITRMIGAHADWFTSVWIGLPGPRLEPKLPIPFGTDSAVRASVTFFSEVGLGLGGDRSYGYGEVELEAQVALIGADVGIDVWEFVDLVLGLITLDPVGDDM